MLALQGASLSPALGSISQMDCTVQSFVFISFCLVLFKVVSGFADKFYYMPVVCVCGRVIMLWFIFGGTCVKTAYERKIIQFKKIWSTALVHLPQSPGKVLLSKFTVVHVVLLCDQSICATKTLWKDARCPWYWGFHFFENWNFLPSVYWDCFHSTCGVGWNPDFNLLVSRYNENLACKTPLKHMRSKCHVCMIFKHF